MVIPTKFVVKSGEFKGLKGKITKIDPQKVYSYNDRGFLVKFENGHQEWFGLDEIEWMITEHI